MHTKRISTPKKSRFNTLAQAFAWISPVYVTAVKRGGGILLSSLLGVLLFDESIAGRLGPILTIVSGVTFLCL
jgi:hypothetical protein